MRIPSGPVTDAVVEMAAEEAEWRLRRRTAEMQHLMEAELKAMRIRLGYLESRHSPVCNCDRCFYGD